jgi:hypothetical protein
VIRAVKNTGIDPGVFFDDYTINKIPTTIAAIAQIWDEYLKG